jgi:HEAT repeat protein
LAAIIALRAFGAESRTAIPQLVRLQESSGERIARESADMLMSLGAEGKKAAAVYYIARLGSSKNTAEQMTAIKQLAKLGPDAVRAEPILRQLLAGTDNDQRIAIAGVLGAMGGEARPAIPALTRMVDNRGADVRNAAAEALMRIAPDGKGLGPAMMAAIYNGDRLHATRLAGVVRQTGDLPTFLRRVGDLAENDTELKVRSAARDAARVLSAAAVPASTTLPAPG